MKFTKEEVCKELATQIPTKGSTLNLSERSIKEQVEVLLPLFATEETEMSDFVEKVLPIFKTADANVRNDVSVGIKTYQEQNPPKTVEKTTETQPNGNEDALAALLKRIEDMEKRNADAEKRSMLNQRRDSLVAKMKEKGCKDKEWIDTLLGQVSLDGEEFNVDARVDELIKLYNKAQAHYDPNATPDFPNGSKGDAYVDDVIKAAGAKNAPQ